MQFLERKQINEIIAYYNITKMVDLDFECFWLWIIKTFRTQLAMKAVCYILPIS